jgi:hypothetical protein
MHEADDVVIRAAGPADHDAVVALAGEALGWEPGAEPELFRWKHLANPFGRSPMWVAEVDGQLAAFGCCCGGSSTTPSGVPSERCGRWTPRPSRRSRAGVCSGVSRSARRRAAGRRGRLRVQHAQQPEPSRLLVDGLVDVGRVPVGVACVTPAPWPMPLPGPRGEVVGADGGGELR